MRAALDTNLLVYAEGFGDEARMLAALGHRPGGPWIPGRPRMSSVRSGVMSCPCSP